MAFFYALSDNLHDPADPCRFVAIAGFGPEPDIPLSILFTHITDDQDFRVGQVLRGTQASHLLAQNAEQENLSAIRVLEMPYEGETMEEIARLVFQRLEELKLIPEAVLPSTILTNSTSLAKRKSPKYLTLFWNGWWKPAANYSTGKSMAGEIRAHWRVSLTELKTISIAWLGERVLIRKVT
jgi:hypothetical protein